MDAVFDSNAVFHRLRSSNRYTPQTGGERIVQPLLYQSNNSGLWYRGDDTLNTTMRNLNTAAEYLWTHFDIPIVVSFTDTIKNAGDPRVLSLVAVSIEGSELSASDNLGTALFSTSTSSKQPEGLGRAISTTGTIGGIAQADYSWWQAKVDSATTGLTLAAVRNVISDCTVDKARPSLLIGDRDMFDRVVDLIQPAQRFGDEGTAKAGYETVMISGVNLVVDSHMASTNLFAINENYMKMCYSTEENFKLYPFQMPINQRVLLARLGWSGAVVYSNLRLFGGLTAITS